MTSTRVLVVDDSAFARRVFRDVLTAARGVEVVGSARDGLEALEEIARLSPDVITLDLMMPNLDGLGLIAQLDDELRRRVLVVSISDKESEPAVKALQAGVFDVVHKPTALATDQLYTVGEELVTAVRRCAEAAHSRTLAPPEPGSLARPRATAHDVKLVVIGASTGGPAAITRLVPELPRDFPVPVVVALHIPAGYTTSFAERLDRVSPLRVREARDGDVVEPGTVLVAPGGSMTGLSTRADGTLVTTVAPAPPGSPFAPSVDRLFDSAAHAVGASLLAVVLTGMGEDGLAGARVVKERRGLVMAESWSSAVVYGMPRAVVEAGLTSATLPIHGMAKGIIDVVRARG